MFIGFMRDGIHPIYFSNHNLMVASKNKHTYHEINGKKKLLMLNQLTLETMPMY